MKKPIKLYWHRGAGRSDESRQNFGDYLSRLIVEVVSGRPVEYAPLRSADMMAIGTILANEHKAKRFGFKRRLHVWGSGCGQPDERFSPRHYYHAVRGKETRARLLGSAEGVMLGDPGLLANLLIKAPTEKKYRVGFVPHYVDQDSDFSRKLMAWDSRIQLINVYAPPLAVIAQIASCQFIISSSLHGLVISDAFSIPNIRARISHGIIDELKFVDYYSAFGIEAPPVMHDDHLLSKDFSLTTLEESVREAYRRPALDQIKNDLYSSFPRNI